MKKLTSLLGLGCPFEEVDPFRCCLQFSASSHHDQVVILSSGSPSSYERDQGKNFGGTYLHEVCASDSEFRK